MSNSEWTPRKDVAPATWPRASGPPGLYGNNDTRSDAVSTPFFVAPSDGPWIDPWLSTARLSRYLGAAGGDRARALELYEWNAQLSSVFHRDLAHFEIALRNAYDGAAGASWGGTGHWLLNGSTTVFKPLMRTRRLASGTVKADINKRSREQIREAISKSGGATAATPGKVVAELSFGFWRFLSSSAHEKTIWVPFLHQAFPPKTVRSNIDGAIGRLHTLRNRIAHHEHLLNEDVVARSSDLLGIVRSLSPDLENHIASTTQITALVGIRP